MMAEPSYVALAARGSRLVKSLYEAAAVRESISSDFERAARGVGGLVQALKQIGASLDNDNSVLSGNALHTLQSVTAQANKTLISLQVFLQQETEEDDGEELWGLSSKARLNYLVGHLDSLKLTLMAMHQVFHTVTISRRFKPQGPYATKLDVEDEMVILENIVTEQQTSIMQAFNLYDDMQHDSHHHRRVDTALPSLLSEKTLLSDDTRDILASKVSRKPTTHEAEPHDMVKNVLGQTSNNATRTSSETSVITPALLYSFYAPSLTSLTNAQCKSKRLSAVLRVVSSYTVTLLHQWGCFRDDGYFESIAARLAAGTRVDSWEKQATVETAPESESGSCDQADIQDEDTNLPAPVPRRMPSSQSILSQTSFVAPATHDHWETPSTTPRGDLTILHSSTIPEPSQITTEYFPQSPRSSAQSIPPIRAAAAAISKEPENGDDLEIPWRLCLHNSYWDFVDASFAGTNTHLQPSEAYRDRRGFTEISASWVCRQAIEEEKYDYLQVQKSVVSGRSSKLETAFIVHRPLQFGEVEKLVERTIEIVQEKADDDVSKHLHQRHQLLPQSQQRVQYLSLTHPTLDRSRSSPAAPVLQSGPSYPDFYNQMAPSNLSYSATRHRPPSRRSSTHSHTSHQSSYSFQGADSPTMTFSESDTDSQEERKERRRNRKDKAPKTKGGNKRTISTLAKIGGAVALLEGLEHAF